MSTASFVLFYKHIPKLHCDYAWISWWQAEASVTFQRFDDLQAVWQVGPGSSWGAAGVPWAAVGVVGARRCCWAGDQAVIWCQEATGAVALLALCCQGVEFTLTLHIKEWTLRRVVLLAGWQAAQGGFQVLASWCAWLAQTFWTTMVNTGE